MRESDYPALYVSANTSSIDVQARFLALIRGEYFLLLVAAVMSIGGAETPLYYWAYALVFVAAAAILLYRSAKKPEQDWYRCRALAESIKTATWRYMMRAEPFGDAHTVQVPRAEFRNFLLQILRSNQPLGDALAPTSSADDQVTAVMEQTRAESLEGRKEMYRKYRVRDQRQWYAKKASDSRRASRFWVGATVVVYALAIASVLLRMVFIQWRIWPTEPLIVLAAAFTGWMQVKKFNELASAYTLTAQEIGIIQTRLGEVSSEGEFSDFVNEAELAFSREHTQWVARQQHD